METTTEVTLATMETPALLEIVPQAAEFPEETTTAVSEVKPEEIQPFETTIGNYTGNNGNASTIRNFSSSK